LSEERLAPSIIAPNSLEARPPPMLPRERPPLRPCRPPVLSLPESPAVPLKDSSDDAPMEMSPSETVCCTV
jgi:hypothetical protein